MCVHVHVCTSGLNLVGGEHWPSLAPSKFIPKWKGPIDPKVV